MTNTRGTIHNTVQVHSNVRIGNNVTVGPYSIIYDNVEIGDNCFIGPYCSLGEPVAAFYENRDYENPPLVIGKDSIIRSHSVIYAGSIFGEYLQTGNRVTIREESAFGEHCSVGTLSDIQGHVEIGKYCRFHSNVHIGQKSTVRDYVWIFPYAVLTNDPHPPSNCIQGPVIDEFAVIAAGAIVLPGVFIGKDSLVGAQALVTKDVPPETVVAGVPARILCSIHDVKCREGCVEKPYPWRYTYSRGYPWSDE